jgi:hypothetical protein
MRLVPKWSYTDYSRLEEYCRQDLRQLLSEFLLVHIFFKNYDLGIKQSKIGLVFLKNY